jgi:glycosyltransferase involved in cell wall biosynthesis
VVDKVNRLKVLTLCSWYPNDFNPTLGNFVQKHADTIALQNKAVALAIFPSTTDTYVRLVHTTRNGLDELVVYYPKQEGGFSLLRKAYNFFSHRKAFKSGYNKVLELMGQPDIVHLNIIYPLGIWALWLKWRFKIPYVITENSSGFHVDTEHTYPKPILRLCRIVLRNASVIMPVSKNLKTSLQKLSGRNSFEIICNVVDENLFKAAKKENTTKSRFIHISTGIDSIKNLSGMIRVVNELSFSNHVVHLDIVSDGDIEYAKALHTELGNGKCVNFHSTKTTEEIAHMIASSDALLMFSNYENFPCVIAESMMSGKPVISSSVNGIPEHVHKENGILVEPRDEEALGKAIKAFLSAEVNFDPIEIRAYALEHFSYQRVGENFTNIYRSIL